MTKEQAEAEIKYRLVRLVFFNLRENNLITNEKFNKLLKSAVEEFKPMIGELEVTSIATEREKGYKD